MPVKKRGLGTDWQCSSHVHGGKRRGNVQLHAYPLTFQLSSLHSPNLRFVCVFVQPFIQVFPPFEQQRVAYQLEPGCELQSLVFEHRSQLFFRNVACVLDFVGIRFVVDVGFDKQDIVNYESRRLARNLEHIRQKLDLLSCSPHFPSLGAL